MQTALVSASLWWPSRSPAKAAEFVGRIVDADTRRPIAGRVYIHNDQGGWHFVTTKAPGSAVEYRKQRGENSVEMHTTVSAHPFKAELPPGTYRVTVHRGKEYFPATREIVVADRPVEEKFALKRWINLARRGWYSGDTHNHRSLEELPNVAIAEDLNVSLPLTYWVTQAFKPPSTSDKSTQNTPSKLIQLDESHVIYPRNTEYEIFSVDGKRHTLGAVFVLGHKSAFESGVPPVKPVAEQARREGALLELDKHNWPWSMALIPVMDVDLFELTNNHVWRTEFYFRRFGESPLEWMHIEQDAEGMTERGWIEFGFQNYYALLNCGFRLRPTAGTASGVHPVPLGFGRVYVHLPGGFSYEKWMQGLDAGRSFVTTGPMLFAEFNGRPPGHVFKANESAPLKHVRIAGSAVSSHPLDKMEIVAAGAVVRTIRPENARTAAAAFESSFDERIELDGSTWLAVRCFEKRPGGRVRFAHTAPVHVDVSGKLLRPRRREALYLVDRVKSQIERSRDILPAAALREYHEALRAYEKALETAR